MSKPPPKYPHIRNPSTRIYWDDLHDEAGLKIVSLAARGLWTYHMLAIMAGAGGYLALEGKPLTVDALSALVGKPREEVSAAFAELEQWEVFSRDRYGTPYNRRMLKAQKKAKTSAANGKAGGRPKSDLSTGQAEFALPVDNSAPRKTRSRHGVEFVPSLTPKTPQKRPIAKSLNGNGNSDLKTYSEPTANLHPNLNGGPRARGFQDSSMNQIYPDSSEKNPASANGHANGHGRDLTNGEVMKRITRTLELPDDKPSRLAAIALQERMTEIERAELHNPHTQISRVTAILKRVKSLDH